VTVAETEVLDPVEIADSVDCSAATFLNNINQGGLICPTVYLFELAVHCWCVFEEMTASADLMSQFLAAVQHCSLFSKIIDRASPALCQYSSIDVIHSCCTVGHDLKELIVQRFFVCMAKNLVKELTNKASAQGWQTKRCKIAKLQSKSSSLYS